MINKNKYLIVLVNYKNYQDTIDCIDSLLVAKVKISDILVIDNGSPNNSVQEIYKKYPNIDLIQNNENLGFAAANNIGIKTAIDKNFEYVILLNNDTLVELGSIEILINKMDNVSDAALGTGKIMCYPEKDKVWYAGGRIITWRGLAIHFHKNKKEFNLQKKEKPIFVSFISGCYLCIRLSSISLLGNLEERFFIYLEDIEYSIRAAKKNLKLLYVPDSLIYHKWVGETRLSKQTLYYAIRNRNLLIDLSFGKIARTYFFIILRLKIGYWFLVNKDSFKAAIIALTDYKRNYYGPIKNQI